MPTIRCNWKKLLVKTSLWLVSEVVLGLCGTDTIADYSEFLGAQQESAIALSFQPSITLVA
jgi:hypothetical protein